jgi:putative hemolysin
MLPNLQLPRDVIQPVPAGLLYAEVARLPPECRLFRQGEYEVLVARAPQMPALLREIDRLRELTRGGIDEGADQHRDVDPPDTDDLHLFMWNAANGDLVGGYRIGRLDDLLARHGLRRMNSSSLGHKSGPGAWERLGPALEISDPFVRTEYQRQPTALALLWRGIGAYLVRNPRYKILSGPVSINGNDRGRLRPTLLNARILSFNVNASFGRCVDGLILVDLRSPDPKILRRFMGDVGLAQCPSVP